MANLFEPGPPAVPDLARRTAVAELRAMATRYRQLAAECSDLTSPAFGRCADMAEDRADALEQGAQPYA